MKIKTEINKWDLIKCKSFCRANETIKKDNPKNGRKYLQMKKPTKELTSETYKQHAAALAGMCNYYITTRI